MLAAVRRRHLTPAQRVAHVLELDSTARMRRDADALRRANLRGALEVATLPPRGGKTRDRVARLASASPRLVQDVQTVRDSDPELFQRVKEGTLAAQQAARQIRQAELHESMPPAPPLPSGPFDLVYADPPWPSTNPTGAKAPENHYPTMELGEIVALRPPVGDDAVLLLWAVNYLLPNALQVIEAWGFEYAANFVWVKPSIGLGSWTRNRHELLLVGRRGRVRPPAPRARVDSVIEAPRGRHSEKPACLYELIDQMYPRMSKLELFRRGSPRSGWAAWGNEVKT